MRMVGLALMMAMLPVGAHAQPEGGTFDIRAWVDEETGERVASSIGNGDVKERLGYSAAAGSRTIMWIEARQKGTEQPRVYIVSQRLRWTLPSETDARGKFGRSDPKDPAYIGTPFSKADLQTRWTIINCINEAYYCSRVDENEIALSPELVSKFTAANAAAEIPVALTRKNRIDWRVPKAELMRVLEALAARRAD